MTVSITLHLNYLFSDNFHLNLNKLLLNKADFFFYSSHNFKEKQGLEIFNLYFKDLSFYLFYTNLKLDSNRKLLSNIIDSFKSNINLLKENFAFVVLDNEKVFNTNIKIYFKILGCLLNF